MRALLLLALARPGRTDAVELGRRRTPTTPRGARAERDTPQADYLAALFAEPGFPPAERAAWPVAHTAYLGTPSCARHACLSRAARRCGRTPTWSWSLTRPRAFDGANRRPVPVGARAPPTTADTRMVISRLDPPIGPRRSRSDEGCPGALGPLRGLHRAPESDAAHADIALRVAVQPTRAFMRHIATFCGQCSCGCPSCTSTSQPRGPGVVITDDFGQRIQMSFDQLADPSPMSAAKADELLAGNAGSPATSRADRRRARSANLL